MIPVRPVVPQPLVLPGEDRASAVVVPPLPPEAGRSRVPGQREGTESVFAARLPPETGDPAPPVDGPGEGPRPPDGAGRVSERERDVVPVDRPEDRPRGRVERIGQRAGQAATELPKGDAVGEGGALIDGLDLVVAVQVPLLQRPVVAAVPYPAGAGVCRGGGGRRIGHPGPACYERSRGREAGADP